MRFLVTMGVPHTGHFLDLSMVPLAQHAGRLRLLDDGTPLVDLAAEFSANLEDSLEASDATPVEGDGIAGLGGNDDALAVTPQVVLPDWALVDDGIPADDGVGREAFAVPLDC